MRIQHHPIIDDYKKGKEVTFLFDGKKMKGYEGESIAAALRAAGGIFLGAFFAQLVVVPIVS